MKHTPAPWIVKSYGYGDEKQIFVVPKDYDRNVEERDGLGIVKLSKGFDDEANAHLIASAPELLEACKKIESCYDKVLVLEDYKAMWNEVIKAMFKCKQAIAKAEVKQ